MVVVVCSILMFCRFARYFVTIVVCIIVGLAGDYVLFCNGVWVCCVSSVIECLNVWAW